MATLGEAMAGLALGSGNRAEAGIGFHFLSPSGASGDAPRAPAQGDPPGGHRPHFHPLVRLRLDPRGSDDRAAYLLPGAGVLDDGTAGGRSSRSGAHAGVECLGLGDPPASAMAIGMVVYPYSVEDRHPSGLHRGRGGGVDRGLGRVGAGDVAGANQPGYAPSVRRGVPSCGHEFDRLWPRRLGGTACGWVARISQDTRFRQEGLREARAFFQGWGHPILPIGTRQRQLDDLTRGHGDAPRERYRTRPG